MLEHILQNDDHVFDIYLVVAIDIADGGCAPIRIDGLRLIPALAGRNIELIDRAVAVDIIGCAAAHRYGRGRRLDRAQ